MKTIITAIFYKVGINTTSKSIAPLEIQLFLIIATPMLNSIQMANLGVSDHNLAFVRPKYLPIVQRIKPKTALVKN